MRTESASMRGATCSFSLLHNVLGPTFCFEIKYNIFPYQKYVWYLAHCGARLFGDFISFIYCSVHGSMHEVVLMAQ